MADYLQIAKRIMSEQAQTQKPQEQPPTPPAVVPSEPDPVADPSTMFPDLVAWRDELGRLQGGDEDRLKGTVKETVVGSDGFTFIMEDGTRVPERRVVSAARLNAQGKVVAAWSTRAHGIDGERGEP